MRISLRGSTKKVILKHGYKLQVMGKDETMGRYFGVATLFSSALCWRYAPAVSKLALEKQCWNDGEFSFWDLKFSKRKMVLSSCKTANHFWPRQVRSSFDQRILQCGLRFFFLHQISNSKPIGSKLQRFIPTKVRKRI